MFSYNKSTHLYCSSVLGDLPHGFGTKLTGDGRDIDVITNILNKEDITYDTIVIPSQTHSTNVAVITDKGSDNILKPENTDAVVTNRKGIVLTVVTADCVPILYHDPQAGIIGISHNGWKGTLNKLSEIVIQRMIEQGADPKDIRVAIGPSIKGTCYAVDPNRAEQFRNIFPYDVVLTKAAQMYMDLPEANRTLLRQIGISDTQIDQSDHCTHCTSEQYFSFRRDRTIRGEMLSYILL